MPMDKPRIDFSSLQEELLRHLLAESGQGSAEAADAARTRVSKLLRELLELDVHPDRHLLSD